MSEMRRDPLTKRWVLCGSEFGIRQVKSFYYSEDIRKTAKKTDVKKDKLCPLCAGNEHMTPPELYSIRDNNSSDNGWKVRVVPHRFPILRVEGSLGREGIGLHDKMNPIGAHEVIIESPLHSRFIVDNEQLRLTFIAARERMKDLLNDSRFKYIMFYKNQGDSSGIILTHPHSHIVALPIVPIETTKKLQTALEHYELKDRCIYCDMIKLEQKLDERIVYSNEDFIAIVTYAARFPFEIMILPLKHCSNFTNNSDEELKSLADIIIVLKEKLKKALSTENFRYMLFNTPIKFQKRGYWFSIERDYHWHIVMFPIITKEIGFEWGTDFYVNPILSEEAAEYLKNI